MAKNNRKTRRNRNRQQNQKTTLTPPPMVEELPPLEAYAEDLGETPEPQPVKPAETKKLEISETDSLGESLATAEEVMQYLQISKRTLQRLIAEKEIPGIMKIGGSNRFDRAKIRSWVKEQTS